MQKITYLSTFLFLFIVYGLKAQEFKSGLRLGLNASQINGDAMAGFNKPGLVSGIFVSYPFNAKWSGQFEMLYSNKGSKRVIYEELGSNSPGNWDKLAMHYIEVPVMAKYHFSKRISVHGGLGGAYLFSSKLIGKSGLESTNPDFLKQFELSGFGGAEYQLTPKLSGYVRYTNSITSVGTGNASTLLFPAFGGLVNLVASFGLFYHFAPVDI